MTSSVELGIRYLTLFGFSSENWKRPEGEIADLMGLLRHYLRGEIAELHNNHVRVRVIGERGKLAPDIVTLIENAEKLTGANTQLNLSIALSYGGRADIADVCRLSPSFGSTHRSHASIFSVYSRDRNFPISK